MRNPGLIFSVALTCSCRPAPTAEQTSGIVGGTLDNGDPSVVLLLRQSQQGDEICTGSFISPDVVLTAAHCVAPDPGGAQGGDRFFIIPGADAMKTPMSQALPVAKVDFDPQYDPNQDPTNSPATAGHDIGVALLSQPMPGVVPLALNAASVPASAAGAPETASHRVRATALRALVPVAAWAAHTAPHPSCVGCSYSWLLGSSPVDADARTVRQGERTDEP
jgi:hypothetical protein